MFYLNEKNIYDKNVYYWIKIYFDWTKIYFDIMGEKSDILKIYFIEPKFVLTEWKYILISWKKGDIMKMCFIRYKIILTEWKYIFISYEFLFLQHFSNHTQWRFIFHLYFSNQIEFHLKSINQELFLKLLKKHCIQYFTLELLIMNWGRCYLRI